MGTFGTAPLPLSRRVGSSDQYSRYSLCRSCTPGDFEPADWVPVSAAGSLFGHILPAQPFLELTFSILLPAFGSALLFNLSASTGGTDIAAMIIKKYTSLDIGKALFCTDILITLGSFFAFGIETGLFSILGLLSKALIVDAVIENINLSKYFMTGACNGDNLNFSIGI